MPKGARQAACAPPFPRHCGRTPPPRRRMPPLLPVPRKSWIAGNGQWVRMRPAARSRAPLSAMRRGGPCGSCSLARRTSRALGRGARGPAHRPRDGPRRLPASPPSCQERRANGRPSVLGAAASGCGAAGRIAPPAPEGAVPYAAGRRPRRGCGRRRCRRASAARASARTLPRHLAARAARGLRPPPALRRLDWPALRRLTRAAARRRRALAAAGAGRGRAAGPLLAASVL